MQHSEEPRRNTVLYHRLQLALQGQAGLRHLHDARSKRSLRKRCSEGMAGFPGLFGVGGDRGREGEERAVAQEIGRQVLSY
jgi:hypothetical protein